MQRAHIFAFTLALLGAATATADDLTGTDRFLCSAIRVFQCPAAADGCQPKQPWELNVPQFIEVDLVEKTLSTTAASGENRSTPIESLMRAAGQIFLQGLQRQRAYSIVIAEETGELTASTTTDGLSIVTFGACTPMPSKQ